MNTVTPNILVVDDEPFNVDILREYLGDTGYSVETAHDGLSAWALLEANPAGYDVVILDRMMPGLDGIQVLERIRRHPQLQGVPVILQTALAAKEEVVEGLQAGAYYYLTKPFDRAMLRSVLSTAVEDRMRYRQVLEDSAIARRTFGMLREAAFSFRTLQSARDLANLLADAFPEPRRVVIGLCELLVNAVEHGNLGIGYAEKTRLREQERWEQEIEARLAHPANAHKEVRVRYVRERDRIRVLIKDQGDGFDWRNYLQMDPSRAFDTHGRGIAMACLVSFDALEYRGNGSEVEVTVELPAA